MEIPVPGPMLAICVDCRGMSVCIPCAPYECWLRLEEHVSMQNTPQDRAGRERCIQSIVSASHAELQPAFGINRHFILPNVP